MRGLNFDDEFFLFEFGMRVKLLFCQSFIKIFVEKAKNEIEVCGSNLINFEKYAEIWILFFLLFFNSKKSSNLHFTPKNASLSLPSITLFNYLLHSPLENLCILFS
jgi:hypothetical protein